MSLAVITVGEAMRLPELHPPAWTPGRELVDSVARIITDVRARGDAALGTKALRVAVPMIEGARTFVPPEIADGLRLSRERLTRFYERQRNADLNYVDEDGTRYGMRYRPFESVAIHVVGGSAASSVLLAAVPARVAGVGRVIALAQPNEEGAIHPAVMYAAALCEIDELYRIGGPAAIAAAAYGTDSVARVDKIVGGGSADVVEAKRQISGVCAIDGLGSAPDVLVIADDGANSEFVAGELLAQAERDPLARVAVVSESRPLLEAVAQLLDTLDVRTLERGDIICAVLSRSAHFMYASARDEIFEVVDRFAPSRVSLQVRDAEPYLGRLRRVGAVYVGDQTPLVCGPYLAGTHDLRLSDFTYSYTVVENSRERMEHDAHALAALAEFEGLPEHAQSARMRGGN